MASCIQFSPRCWGYSWWNKVASCSFLKCPFVSILPPIIYYSLLCRRFTSRHYSFWQPWQQLVAVTWRECPLTTAVSACKAQHSRERRPFSCLWGRQVSPASPSTRESCSPACASCLHFHWIPLLAPLALLSSLGAGNVQGFNPSLMQFVFFAVITWPSPQGTRWVSTSQAQCFFPTSVCVSAPAASFDFIPVAHR